MEQIFEQTSNPRRKSGLTHFTFKQVHSTWRLCRSFLLSGAANKLELFKQKFWGIYVSFFKIYCVLPRSLMARMTGSLRRCRTLTADRFNFRQLPSQPLF